jgi:hypothetical protein
MKGEKSLEMELKAFSTFLLLSAHTDEAVRKICHRCEEESKRERRMD